VSYQATETHQRVQTVNSLLGTYSKIWKAKWEEYGKPKIGDIRELLPLFS
jgi:hypothetical protein